MSKTRAAEANFSRALTKCDQDDVLEADFLANSVFLLRFVTCVEVTFAFCVAGAILCAGAFYKFVARAAFCDVAKVVL